MNYTIEGKVVVVTETTQITEKFAKREIVIETDDKYPQQVMLEFSQDKCQLLDECKQCPVSRRPVIRFYKNNTPTVVSLRDVGAVAVVGMA